MGREVGREVGAEVGAGMLVEAETGVRAGMGGEVAAGWVHHLPLLLVVDVTGAAV